MPASSVSESESKVIRKGNVHHHRLPPLLQTALFVIHHKVILLILVVFLILECEPHPEDALLSIFFPTVRHITVFIRDFLIVFREEEDAVFCYLYSIADGIRLDKVQGSNQVRNLTDDADRAISAFFVSI